MIRLQVIITILTFMTFLYSQESIKLWPDGKMLNSKGLKLEEINARQRITQVDIPLMEVFRPAQEEQNGTAVLILPSGGYHHLTYALGGTSVAKWFNTLGITAFVLKYRLPTSPDLITRQLGPLQDTQRALRIILSNAHRWNIKKDKIGVFGSSSGGHLAATLGTYLEDVSAIGDSLDTWDYQPDFLILISPVITMKEFTHQGSLHNLLGDNPSQQLIEQFSAELHVSDQTPAVFLVHAADDKAVNPKNSLLFYNVLVEKKIPASLHIFPYGGHSIGILNNPGSTALWLELCEKWLIEMDFIPGS